MTRRLALLPLAFLATVSLVLAACGSPPSAPALTDPKDIVAKGVASLADVKSFEFTGTFSGTVAASQLGSFDLSDVKLAGAVDVTGRTMKVNLDAPALLGTKVDAIVVGDTAYYKLAGALATVVGGGRADKYTKLALPTASGEPLAAMTDVTKLVAQLQDVLAKLPSPLTRAADERCNDADCYHVSTVLSAAQLQALGAGAEVDGDVTVDLWTRKTDYRPAKIGLAVASPGLGSFGVTVELRYDVGVSVAAPPADQIAP